jgi:hypothetical protein
MPDTNTMALRLRRLQALVDRRADPTWGREEINRVLEQATCPRYAGIIAESGDECVVVAETADELADEMAAHADSEIPIVPVELIDLDTGESRIACRTTRVSFLDQRRVALTREACEASLRAGRREAQPDHHGQSTARVLLYVDIDLQDDAANVQNDALSRHLTKQLTNTQLISNPTAWAAITRAEVASCSISRGDDPKT